MARQFSDYTDQFFWDFKRMDNVNYNFEIVELLYEAKKQANNNPHFNKPLIILLVAIIECMLYDFLIRIQTRSNDPLPNLAEPVINFFKNSNTTDELKRLIPEIKSQNLLNCRTGDTIYGDLEDLRIVRNRLHIQNKYNALDKDELRVFTNTELRKAEHCFEKICETLCNVYPRWNKQPLPMVDFPRPWF